VNYSVRPCRRVPFTPMGGRRGRGADARAGDRHRRVNNSGPRVWELAHVASTPPKSPPTPAAAPSSNPHRTSLTRWCPHRRASHHRGRPQARRGTPACAGLGAPAPKGRGAPHPRAVSTPPASPGRSSHSQPRAGVAGDRIRLGRRRAATGWQFPQPGAQPGAHPVTGMRIKPAHRLPPPPDPAPKDGSGGCRTAQPGKHPTGQDRTRCSPPAPAAPSRPALCAARSCNQPTTVTVSGFLSSYDSACCTAAVVTLPVPPSPWPTVR
jgi:hypothetical protein